MRSFSAKRNLLISCLTFLLVVTGALGQTGTTSLRGTVLDKTGASVTDAKVALDNLAQAFHREIQSGSTGQYEFAGLPPWHFRVDR